MEAVRHLCYLFSSSSFSQVQASPSVSFWPGTVVSISKAVSASVHPPTQQPPAGSPSPPSSLSRLISPLASSTFYKAFALFLLLSLLPSSPAMVKEADLQKMFKLRNENEWKSLWHAEKHVRCRDQLLNHMDWACQKDIYRLEKKFTGVVDTQSEDHEQENPLGDIFIGKAAANTIVKPWTGYGRRKREEKSITDECCSPVGCTWEEYAEYCPAHRRLQTRRYVETR